MPENYQNSLLNTCDDDLKTAMDAYNISKRAHDDYIGKLKDWIKLQPHFPMEEIKPRVLARLLMQSDYSVEKTKQKLEKIYMVRSEFPELFNNRKMTDFYVEKLFQTIYMFPMPQLTNHRHRIFIIGDKHKELNIDLERMFKLYFAFIDLKFWWETSIGEHIIWDCSNTTVSQVLKIAPALMKKLSFALENYYSGKLKGVHIINAQNNAINLINSTNLMWKKKFRKRIHIHKTVKDLHLHVSPRYLPKNLGGSGKSYPELSDMWYHAMKSEQVTDILRYFDRLKFDKNKKPPSALNQQDVLLGINGSFRKLEFN